MNSAFVCMVAALLFVGCTTKNKAQIRAQQAYIAGQQQAMAQMQQSQNQVQFIGNVQNSTVPFTEGLTLAQAIVAAEYRGFRDPAEIIIYRHGQTIPVNPRRLLRGEDHLLEPGDRVILR